MAGYRIESNQTIQLGRFKDISKFSHNLFLLWMGNYSAEKNCRMVSSQWTMLESEQTDIHRRQAAAGRVW